MYSPYMKENSSNEILFYLIFFMIKHKYILGIYNIQYRVVNLLYPRHNTVYLNSHTIFKTELEKSEVPMLQNELYIKFLCY